MSRDSARPWLCPERERCQPLLNLRDGDYKDLTVPEVGHSWTCWGRMEQPVTFIYDGVDHTNDLNCCHYTPLKGLIRWQENAGDWETLCTYYGLATKLARQAAAEEVALPHPCTECGATVTECDDHIKAKGRGCCGACYMRDTHGMLGREG